MKNKKITFLISSLAGGGAEGVCVNVANGLAQNGWNVELVILHMNNAVYHTILEDKVKLIVLDINNARYALFALIKFFYTNKIEKIVVFNYELTVMTIIARFFCINKFEIVARNINTISKNQNTNNDFSYKSMIRKMIDIFYTKADFIINQSKGMMDDLLTVYPEVKNKTQVIYNPVRQQIEEISKTINFEDIKKKDFILCVGRLEEQKAFHLAIESFCSISKKFPNIRLKIVGQGRLENDLKALAKNLNIDDKIDFEGFQKDVISYYKSARLVLFTSLYEGFPNVLVESITLGTPVVAFDCQSGPSEIIENEINGYLVNFLDKEDLNIKIEKALETKWDFKKVHASSLKYNGKFIFEEWESLIEK